LKRDCLSSLGFKLPILEGDNFHNILNAKMNVKTSDILKENAENRFKLIFEYVRGLDLHKENWTMIRSKELFFNCAKEAGISFKSQ
jgi:hypothetical protein